jgi:hypothetical protein
MVMAGTAAANYCDGVIIREERAWIIFLEDF